MIHYQYKFLGVIRIFGQFKEEKLMQLGYFFSGEKQKFRLSQRFCPTSYVTLLDISRYDLIVKINEKA